MTMAEWIRERQKKLEAATCRNCSCAEIFDKRPDEPSQNGCRARGIEGYVLDPDHPRCVLRLDWREGSPKDKRVKERTDDHAF